MPMTSVGEAFFDLTTLIEAHLRSLPHSWEREHFLSNLRPFSKAAQGWAHDPVAANDALHGIDKLLCIAFRNTDAAGRERLEPTANSCSTRRAM